MTAWPAIVASPATQRLAWTLLHFVWQGAAIAALYLPIRRALEGASARTRYAAACAILMCLAAAPVATWLRLSAVAAPTKVHPTMAAAPRSQHIDGFTAPAASPSAMSGKPAPVSDAILAMLVLAWLLGVIGFMFRNAGAWISASRLPRQRVEAPAGNWERRTASLARRLRVSRPVRLLASAAISGPVVVGWLRPVILVPMSAFTGLPPDQLEAVLAHELAHIRRFDYLVNLAQTAAETLLFFHPAVWWVSAQVRNERECCCDDLAVAVSGDALVYAHALLALETGRPVRPRPLLAATGGALSRRIARLIGAPGRAGHAAPAPAPIFAALVMVAAVATLAMMHRAAAQSAPLPRFEVASIKPHMPRSGLERDGIEVQHGGLHATSASLEWLMSSAYNVQDYQLVGAPDWMTTERWDVEAHGDASAKDSQVELMVRALIEDRFQFRYHLESRELPVYVLSPGKNGLRLPAPDPAQCKGPDGEPEHSPLSVIHPTPTGVQLIGCAMPMAELVHILEMSVHRPVTDLTGAAAPFDFNLTFANDNPAAAFAEAGAASDPAPSLSTALEETLGLRLQYTKGPVQVMVIDHIARPTPN